MESNSSESQEMYLHRGVYFAEVHREFQLGRIYNSPNVVSPANSPNALVHFQHLGC